MYKTKENKKGISLIVLVITIIVVVIIAAAIILTLTGNNPIAEARKATFLNDVATFRDDLNMYKTNEYAKRMGDYDPSLLNATSSGLTYNGTSISGQDNIYDVIPSLEGKTKYLNEFEVSSGEIKYTGTNTEKADWSQNIAGITADSAKPTIDIITSNVLPVKAGTSVIYNISMTSSVAITTTNLSGNIKILNNAGAELTTQPNINIGSVTGTEKEKTAIITINTTGMPEGIYKIKILGDGVKTASQGNIESISTSIFEIDNTAPNMPTITLNPTIATNGNVTVTITKANASDMLEYSTNGTTWVAYTTDLTVTSNLTVYAREIDSANNVSNQATQIISNIDKTIPQNATMSLTTASDKINGTITIADSGSGMNVSQSKYLVTTQSTAYGVADVVWNSATVMGVTSKTISETKADGTYYVQVLSVDNAGNKLVNVSSSIIVQDFPIVGKSFASYTFEEIGMIAEKGLAENYFKVGDEKNITLSTGEVLTIQIYDFNHDILANGGGKSNITFGLKNLMSTKLIMTNSGGSGGGWPNCNIRAYLNGITTSQQLKDHTSNSVYSQLPSSLRNIIVDSTKYTSNCFEYGGPITSTKLTTTDKLFLFSYVETWGENTIEDGKRYAIFANNSNEKKMFNGSYSLWWLRTARYMYISTIYGPTMQDGFYIIPETGFTYLSGLDGYQPGAINFGFCIGNAPTNTYSVTFDSKGGSSITNQTIILNNKVNKPIDPIKSGFIFDGWYKDSNCTQSWDFNTSVITSNTTLYAKWKI